MSCPTRLVQAKKCSMSTARSATEWALPGPNLGPTLIDSVYHPGHHSDFSIRNAVSRGTKQHHWSFGDMPPVAGVSPDDVKNIICYVREIQLANGIFEPGAYSTIC